MCVAVTAVKVTLKMLVQSILYCVVFWEAEFCMTVEVLHPWDKETVQKSKGLLYSAKMSSVLRYVSILLCLLFSSEEVFLKLC